MIQEEMIKEMFKLIFKVNLWIRERLKFSRRALTEDNEEVDDYLKVSFKILFLKLNFKLEDNKFSFEEKEIQICECSVKDSKIDQIVKFIKKTFAWINFIVLYYFVKGCLNLKLNFLN